MSLTRLLSVLRCYQCLARTHVRVYKSMQFDPIGRFVEPLPPSRHRPVFSSKAAPSYDPFIVTPTPPDSSSCPGNHRSDLHFYSFAILRMLHTVSHDVGLRLALLNIIRSRSFQPVSVTFFVPVYCWVIVHGMDMPGFVSPFTHQRTLDHFRLGAFCK